MRLDGWPCQRAVILAAPPLSGNRASLYAVLETPDPFVSVEAHLHIDCAEPSEEAQRIPMLTAVAHGGEEPMVDRKGPKKRPLRNLCNISKKLVFWFLLPSDGACRREKNTETQRSRRRGATIASVPSVPLCFKGLNKNLVLLGPRS